MVNVRAWFQEHSAARCVCYELISCRKAKQSDKSRKRRNDRSQSRSPEPNSRHKRSKRTKGEGSSKPSEMKADTSKETEEEYDARLEREERERIESAKRRELERMTRLADRSLTNEGGVRFKGLSLHVPPEHRFTSTIGRGRMKFIDPELHHRR